MNNQKQELTQTFSYTLLHICYNVKKKPFRVKMVFWLRDGYPLVLNCYPFISTLYKLGYVFVEVIMLSHEYLTTIITLKHFTVRSYDIIKMDFQDL